MRRTAALHTLVGPYVMDAVPAAERAAFERHLAGCEPCRDEVRGLREAAAQLGAAAAVQPRSELREQTLQAAARLRQLPPLVAEPQPAGLAGRAGRLVRRLTAASPVSWSRPKAVHRSWLAVALAAVAVLAAGIVGLGLHAASMQDRLSAVEQRDRAIARVLGSNDAVTLTAKVQTGGTATVVMSHRARALVFTAHQLSVLPVSKAYELWLMGPSGTVAAGMLPPAHDGMSGPLVVSGLAHGDELGLTVEPAAGSPQPSSSPIVLVGLGI
jgi:anti-sigma-K factor RskA